MNSSARLREPIAGVMAVIADVTMSGLSVSRMCTFHAVNFPDVTVSALVNRDSEQNRAMTGAAIVHIRDRTQGGRIGDQGFTSRVRP